MKVSTEEERWASIEGFEGYYEISDYGNVRSLDRVIVNSLGYTSFVKGRTLKPDSSDRYLRVNLVKQDKRRKCPVHVLVAQYFVPNDDPINKTQVDHKKEGNGKDNHYKNLQWLTPRENSVKHVLSKKKASKYIGVHRSHTTSTKWSAVITLNKKGRHLGVFITEEEAAEAYQKALKYINLFGKLPPPNVRKLTVKYPKISIYYNRDKKAFVGYVYYKHNIKKHIIARKDRVEVERVCNEFLNKIK
jgi:hypothetical protein